MSCENDPNKVARLAGQISAGISQLAGKRAFYVGLAVGASGAVSTLALFKAIRRRRDNGKAGPVLVDRARGTVEGSPSGTRARPKKISKEALRRPGSRANPKQIPILARTPADTKLKAATLRIQTGGGQPFTPQSSYRVVRPDGRDTGLAVTPYVREGEDGQLVEDEQNWGLTHSASGSLISGPYGSIAQAQGLANRLADLRWTEAQMPTKDVNRARQIIDAYRSNGENS